MPDSINGSFIGACSLSFRALPVISLALTIQETDYIHISLQLRQVKMGLLQNFLLNSCTLFLLQLAQVNTREQLENQTVFLNGTNSTSAPGSLISSYSWQQIDENGQPLIGKIIDSNKPLAKFVAPEVNEPTCPILQSLLLLITKAQ